MWKNDLEIWEKAKNIWEMAQIHGARLKYLKIGLTIMEMTSKFDKLLKYVGNDIYIWELA